MPVIDDELDILATSLPLQGLPIVAAGRSTAGLACRLLQRYPDNIHSGLEVDQRQHQLSLVQTQSGSSFMLASAQWLPFVAASLDLLLMLKSPHYGPLPEMDQALAPAARVLRPGGWQPVCHGVLNEISIPYSDEDVVRAAAQHVLNRFLQTGAWQGEQRHRSDRPVQFDNVETFEQRIMRPTFTDHRLVRCLHRTN